MPGKYRLVFNTDKKLASPQVTNSKNSELSKILAANGLVKIADEEGQGSIAQDCPRDLLINGKGSSFHSQVNFGSLGTVKELLKKEFGEKGDLIYKEYIQDHSGGIQKKLIVDSLLEGLFVDCINRGNIYKEGDEIFCESVISNIKLVNPNLQLQQNSNNNFKPQFIPGHVYARYKLTPDGFELQYLEPSNKLLQQLCLGNHDVKVLKDAIKKAEIEEKALTSEAHKALLSSSIKVADQEAYERYLVSKISSPIDSARAELTLSHGKLEDSEEVNIDKDILPHIRQALNASKNAFGELEYLRFPAAVEKIFARLLEINTLLIKILSSIKIYDSSRNKLLRDAMQEAVEHSRELIGLLQERRDLNALADTNLYEFLENFNRLDAETWSKKRKLNNHVNDTSIITQVNGDAPAIKQKIEEKMTLLAKHASIFNVKSKEWMSDNGYESSNYPYSDKKGISTQFERDYDDADPDVFEFIGKDGVVVKFGNKPTAEELFTKLRLNENIKRALSYMLHQGGVTAELESLMKYTYRGPKGETLGFSLSNRQVTVRVIKDDEIQIECRAAETIKSMQQGLGLDDIEGIDGFLAPTINAKLSINLNFNRLNAPTVKTSFELFTVKPDTSDFKLKFIAGAVNPSKAKFEEMDLLTPYGSYIAKFFIVNDGDLNKFENALEKNRFYMVAGLGWYSLANNRNDEINKKVQTILQKVYNTQPATESVWKSVAHEMIRLADKELKRILKTNNPKAGERFNYLKQVGYGLLVEIAAVNLAKGLKQEESVSAISRALDYSEKVGKPAHPRIAELLKTVSVSVRMVKVANEKLQSLRSNTKAYERYERVANKGLDNLLADAKARFAAVNEQWEQAKNNNHVQEPKHFVEQVRKVFINLQELNAFLNITNSSINAEWIELYSKYEILGKEISQDQRFKDIDFNDKVFGSIKLKDYIDKIFDYSYEGDLKPGVKFKDLLCLRISQGKASLIDVLEKMPHPSPLTIPYATLFNDKTKNELVRLIKSLNNNLEPVSDNVKKSFVSLLDCTYLGTREPKFVKNVNLYAKSGEHAGTAIRQRILNDSQLIAKLDGKDLAALVKDDIPTALRTLKVGLFDFGHISKKYSVDDLKTLLINAKDTAVAEQVFKDRTFLFGAFNWSHWKKLTRDDLVDIALKTDTSDKHLKTPKFAELLLQATNKNSLENLLSQKPYFFKEVVDSASLKNRSFKDEWKDKIKSAIDNYKEKTLAEGLHEIEQIDVDIFDDNSKKLAKHVPLDSKGVTKIEKGPESPVPPKRSPAKVPNATGNDIDSKKNDNEQEHLVSAPKVK